MKNRNAIKILQINDYPESVIHEAIELSKILDKNVTVTPKILRELYAVIRESLATTRKNACNT